jgi:hypothetical protein
MANTMIERAVRLDGPLTRSLPASVDPKRRDARRDKIGRGGGSSLSGR